MYKVFKRIDGNWSVSNKDTDQTLDLVIPSEELAIQVCKSLEEAYYEGYNSGLGHGYSNGVASL